MHRVYGRFGHSLYRFDTDCRDMRDVIQVCALGNLGSTSSSAGAAATSPAFSGPMIDREWVNVKQLGALVPCYAPQA